MATTISIPTATITTTMVTMESAISADILRAKPIQRGTFAANGQ